MGSVRLESSTKLAISYDIGVFARQLTEEMRRSGPVVQGAKLGIASWACNFWAAGKEGILYVSCCGVAVDCRGGTDGQEGWRRPG